MLATDFDLVVPDFDRRLGLDDKHADVARGVLLDGFALADENFAVRAQQILALHAGLARRGADEQTPVHVLKAFVEIPGGDDAFEQRECAVLDFHHCALELFENLRHVHFDEVEDDGLVRPEDFAGSDPEQE